MDPPALSDAAPICVASYTAIWTPSRRWYAQGPERRYGRRWTMAADLRRYLSARP